MLICKMQITLVSPAQKARLTGMSVKVLGAWIGGWGTCFYLGFVWFGFLLLPLDWEDADLF